MIYDNQNRKDREFASAFNKNKFGFVADLKNSWSNIKFSLHDLVNVDLHIGSQHNLSALGNSWSWSYIIKRNVVFNLKYIYNNLRIFLKNLYERSNVYSDIVYANFNKAFVNFIEKWALKTGVMYIVGTWFRGGLTNFKNFYKFIQICRNDMKRFKAFGRYYSGIFNLTKMPDYLILTSNKDNFSRVLLNEAVNYTTIDLIVLNDSLVDSRGCNFIIPGNEKSMNSLNFLYNLFDIEIQKGRFLYLCERYKSLMSKNKKQIKNLENTKKWRSNLNKEVGIFFKKQIFNNESYFDRFFIWFNFINRRIRQRNESKKILYWWSRFHKNKIRKRRTHFRENFIRTKMRSLKWLRFALILRKKELKKRRSSLLRRGLSYDVPLKFFSKRLKYKRKKSIKSIYFRPLNYSRRIKKDRHKIVPFNSDLHSYYHYKSENFNKFFIKLRKSSSLISLFEKELNGELGAKFNKDKKLKNLNNIWEFFEGRNMNSWWKLHKPIYKNGSANKIRKDFVDNDNNLQKTWRFKKSPISKILTSEAFRFRKISKSRFKYENKGKLLQKKLNHVINYIRLYKECFPNNNYFKNKKKITAVYYRNFKMT
jgi:ribosomal protein S2